MKYIKLTQNKRAIVDNEDYPLLSRFSWQHHNLKESKMVCAQIKGPNQKGFTILMHQMITPSKFGKYIYHKNNNILDNRKSNLDFLSNNYRRHVGRKTTKRSSVYKGVHWCKRDKLWLATITKREDGLKNKQLYRGDNEEEAAKAYNKKAKELYGQYAYQNKI